MQTGIKDIGDSPSLASFAPNKTCRASHRRIRGGYWRSVGTGEKPFIWVSRLVSAARRRYSQTERSSGLKLGDAPSSQTLARSEVHDCH